MDSGSSSGAEPRESAFFEAAAAGDAERVESLLREDPSLVRAEGRGQWGVRKALHVAAEKGQTVVAGLLLRWGAEVDARDEGDNAAPLHWAAGEGHLETARLLLDHGADVNAADDMHAGGPLGWATRFAKCHAGMADFLMERGARPDLFAAIALDRPGLLRSLAAADPGSLSARMSLCEDFQQPVHFAVRRDRLPHLELLGELGADLGARTASGRTPLCIAVEEGKSAIADWLLERGVEIDALAAIALGRDAVAGELLAEEPDRRRLDQALLAAALHGRDAIARDLLDRGASPNATGFYDWMRGVSPLTLAADRGHLGIARLLLERGAVASHRDEYPGATPLHYAAWHGREELVRLLLRSGADPALRDALYNADPHAWAVENRQSAVAALLAEKP